MALGTKSSLWRAREGEASEANLTDNFNGWSRGGIEPAVTANGGGGACSTHGSMKHGKAK
jgi:hypothetical protein